MLYENELQSIRESIENEVCEAEFKQTAIDEYLEAHCELQEFKLYSESDYQKAMDAITWGINEIKKGQK